MMVDERSKRGEWFECVTILLSAAAFGVVDLERMGKLTTFVMKELRMNGTVEIWDGKKGLRWSDRATGPWHHSCF